MEKTGCKVICGAPTTLAVKGLMIMMVMCVCVYVRREGVLVLISIYSAVSLTLVRE